MTIEMVDVKNHRITLSIYSAVQIEQLLRAKRR